MIQTTLSADGKTRCHWCCFAPEFPAYHDTELGFPLADDHSLFEKLSLEGFQSGLSWRTILAKRENFRRAFIHDYLDRHGAHGEVRVPHGAWNTGWHHGADFMLPALHFSHSESSAHVLSQPCSDDPTHRPRLDAVASTGAGG